jgi:hypothetical protein
LLEYNSRRLLCLRNEIEAPFLSLCDTWVGGASPRPTEHHGARQFRLRSSLTNVLYRTDALSCLDRSTQGDQPGTIRLPSMHEGNEPASIQAVTIFADQLFTNSSIRSTALPKLSPDAAKPKRK